jgi:hypothetical protein
MSRQLTLPDFFRERVIYLNLNLELKRALIQQQQTDYNDVIDTLLAEHYIAEGLIAVKKAITLSRRESTLSNTLLRITQIAFSFHYAANKLSTTPYNGSEDQMLDCMWDITSEILQHQLVSEHHL